MQTNTTDQFQVEHVEYVSDRPFDDVVAALEKATGDVTDGKFASEIGSAKDKEDFEERVRSFEADSGFMRFLSLKGVLRRARQPSIRAKLSQTELHCPGATCRSFPGPPFGRRPQRASSHAA
jgi:hypothetical protein